MIPKQIAFYWEGPLYFLRYLTLWSFRRQNPDWPIYLYHPPTSPPDHRVYDLGIVTRLFNPPKPGLKPAQVCDLCRWQHLAHAGGFFSDMDILWRRPLDELYVDTCMSQLILGYSSNLLTIGLLAAEPNLELFHKLCHMLARPSRKRESRYQGYGADAVYELCGLYIREPISRLIKALLTLWPDLDLGVLLPEWIYPFDWEEAVSIFTTEKPVPRDCVGLHWFGGNPVVEEYACQLTEQNWRSLRNTLTTQLWNLKYPSA